MPMAMATRLTPSASSIRPKVKRMTPVLMSVPASPSPSPTATMARLFRCEPGEMVEATTSPSVMIMKYSADEKRSAKRAMAGVNSIISTMAMEPPTKEQMVVTNSASPARPCCVIG